jgi:hypothetical protein
MAEKGYDFCVTSCNEVEGMACRVCGEPMQVRRDVLGPTGFASAMGGRACWTRHDEFWCVSSDEDWHQQALRLRKEATATPSRAIREILEKEIAEVLARRQPTLQ